MNALVRFNRPGMLGNSVFDGFLNNLIQDFPDHLRQSTQGYPVVDIYSNEAGATVMEFALAGFKREELSVDIKPDKRSITVSANTESGNDNSRRIARRNFSKTFVNYDNNLDLSTVTAKYEDGLLSVTVPKKKEMEAITVDID